MQLPSNAINIHDPLRRIPMSQNFRIELAQPFSFFLCQSIPLNQNPNFLNDVSICLNITFSFREFRSQPISRVAYVSFRNERGSSRELRTVQLPPAELPRLDDFA